MDVSDVVVADRPGYLARSMKINATGACVHEHIYANERTGEIIYRIVDPGTKMETDDERVIAVKEGPLRMEFFHRHVSDGYRSYWQAPLDAVKTMLQEERVFALRMDPPRLEMFCRNSKDEMRLDWQAPRSVCAPVFDATVAAAQRM